MKKELSALLSDHRLDPRKKDMLFWALLLMAKGTEEGLDALMAGDEDRLIQLVKDFGMRDVPEDRRRVAEEAVRIADEAALMCHAQAAHDISIASDAHAITDPQYSGQCSGDIEIAKQTHIWYGGYIAGIRHERQRRAT